MAARRRARRALLTIGHSTRSFDELVSLLAENGVEVVVDVRRFPGSRRHPHFARSSLETSLPALGIAYQWVEALGGRRPRRKDTVHTGWQVAAFAGYADHMESPAFGAAARALLALARARRTAIMCAEARPEQCHRRLVADWCTAHGTVVAHVERAGRVRPHQLPPFARVDGGRVVYDGAGLSDPSSG